MSEDRGDYSAMNAEAIKKIVERQMLNLFCYESVPAQVVNYDFKQCLVDVKPLVSIIDNAGEKIENFELQNIPVVYLDCENCPTSIPLKRTTGLLICTKIGIENWQINGGEQEEAITTRFSRRNCFFIPGLHSLKEKKDNNNYGIDNAVDYIKKFFKQEYEFRVKPDGSMYTKLNKSDVVLNNVDILQQQITLCTKIGEIATKLSDALDKLATATYGSIPGPASCAEDLTQIKSEIDTIKGDVDGIKTSFENAKA